MLNSFATKAEALIHGDLHTGSIMLNQEQTYIIDSEFSFIGPISFDLGLLLANLITAWIYHFLNQHLDYCNWLLKLSESIIKDFKLKFCALWRKKILSTKEDQEYYSSIDEIMQYQKIYMLKVLQETFGFAGLEICRRITGIAGVKEIRGIKNIAEKAQQLALKIGQYLVENLFLFNSFEIFLDYMEYISLNSFSES